MSKIEGAAPIVVFDLDGVLIDSAEANVQAFRFGLEKAGVKGTDSEAILSLVGYPADEMLRRLGCPEDDVERTFQEHVRPFYIENLPSLARAYPGARRVLEELKASGFQIAACTSGDRATQTTALKSIDLWDCIEEMQTPDDSEFRKPEIRYLQEVLERFEEHGDVHHVEDSEVGLEMGLNCGATTYFASYGNGSLTGKVKPHTTLKSIRELPRAILRTLAR